MATVSKGPDLCYVRGDLAPLTLRITEDGSLINFVGWTAMELTINSEEDPTTTANEIMVMVGTITGAANDGLVAFRPPNQAASDALVAPNPELFYDVAGINPTGERRTLLKGGRFDVLMDIGKT